MVVPPRPRTIIGAVTYDDVTRKLSDIAPVDPELAAALDRFQHLSYQELTVAFEEHTARFKAWVEDPANEGRPIREWPGYLDRIAIDAHIERRTWME